MKLTTIQPEEVWKLIQKTGEFVCNPKEIVSDEKEFDALLSAYRWMVDVMRARIPNSPKDIKYPIWAWYHNEVDDFNYWGVKGQKYVVITFEVPDDQVLLSDEMEWTCAIMGGPIYENDNWDEFPEDADVETIQNSWYRVLRSPGKYGPDDLIQGTVWRIRKEDVVETREFVSLGSYPGAEDDDLVEETA